LLLTRSWVHTLQRQVTKLNVASDALGGHACAVERAACAHFSRKALNRACTNTTLAGDLQNALVGPQLSQDSLFSGRVNFGLAEMERQHSPQMATSLKHCHKRCLLWLIELV
jgi:hypothetical protein